MSQFSTKKVNHYLELARNASLKSDFPKQKLGAIVVYKNSVLASSCNSTKTSPMQKKYNRARDNFDEEANYIRANSLHAEMSCILKIRYLDIDFGKCSLFVYRETKNGHKALSRPCKACSTAIKALGIKDVYYTIENGWEHIHWD